MAPIQFFVNETDTESQNNVEKCESAGYRVQVAPTSGPMAIWFNGIEVVGSTAVKMFVDQIVMSKAPATNS